MVSFNIPLLMVVTFLLLTLAVGFYFSSKATTFREYAVGNKQFATATLVATVLATSLGGGGLVRSVQQVHSTGLYWIILFLLFPFRFWMISSFALRMGPFMQHLSMADTIGSIYGKYARVITALSGICCSIVTVTGQITVMSVAISMCVDVVNPHIITIFAALIVIAYSMFGGIRAITFTDVLQFVTFAVIIPLLAWYMFIKADKAVEEMIPFLQNQEKFQFSSVFHFDTTLVALIALFLSDIASSIEPPKIQRVYMSSGPMQARRVFLCSTLFGFVIVFFIILVGLFVFVGAPELPVAGVWNYIMTNLLPIFKGLLSISLLAMTMSTADSELNTCAVMVSHDMLGGIKKVKKSSDAYQLRLARLTTLVVGLSSMVVSFYCNDLLKILYWTLDLSVPIITAPFILAIFGFRGTSRTALIGMATGALAIFAWNKWVQPAAEIDGAFVCMIANGLAMMAAHYLLPQPAGKGWVGPDDQFRQIQQAKARARARIKEEIKDYIRNIKENLAKLKPEKYALVYMGSYTMLTTFLTYYILGTMHYWYMLRFVASICFLSCSRINKKATPPWVVGQCWLIGLLFSLPLDMIWHWWHLTPPLFTLFLSLAHVVVTLSLLPAYLGLVVAIVLTLFDMIYSIRVLLLFPLDDFLFSLLGLSLMAFFSTIIIYYTFESVARDKRILYLEEKEKIREAKELRKIAYDSTVTPSTFGTVSKDDGSNLETMVRHAEQSVSFFDPDTPLDKQDFQDVFHKLYGWIGHLKKQERIREHMLLQPTTITLDNLFHKLEFALSQEVIHPPRLLIDPIDDPLGVTLSYVVWDVNETLHLLVQAVLRVSDVDSLATQFVKLQLYTTHLKFEQGGPVENGHSAAITFQAIALVLSNTTTSLESLPKVKSYYEGDAKIKSEGSKQDQRSQTAPKAIDPHKKIMERIIRAHYGYLAYPIDFEQKTMLLVLPTDVMAIRDKMISQLPIDDLTSETVTSKEQDHSPRT